MIYNAPLQKCLLCSVTPEGCSECYLCFPQCFYNYGTSTWFLISGCVHLLPRYPLE
ncbi:hypothetical protein Hanom_Chr13g01214991 [Helianthus anomalus]